MYSRTSYVEVSHKVHLLITSFPKNVRPPSFAVRRVGVGLRKRDAATRTLLGEGIVASYKAGCSNFHVGLEHLYNLGNVRDLVKDEMFHIPSVTKPQAFKVSKDPVDGGVKMQVQARSDKQNWGVIDRYILRAVCTLFSLRNTVRHLNLPGRLFDRYVYLYANIALNTSINSGAVRFLWCTRLLPLSTQERELRPRVHDHHEELA